MITVADKIEITKFGQEVAVAHPGAGVMSIGAVNTTVSKTIYLDTDDQEAEVRIVIDSVVLDNNQMQALVDAHDYESADLARIKNAIKQAVEIIIERTQYLYTRYEMRESRSASHTITSEQRDEYLDFVDSLRDVDDSHESGEISWPAAPAWLVAILESKGIVYPPVIE